jgi:glutamyl/glutaminyl-tRNA synthetase
MRKWNTRFNPTVNGPLHLGHLYVAKVNETEAHISGGKFIVRFDDDQFLWNEIRKCNVVELRDGIKRDLEWAGIAVDTYRSQAEMREETEALLRKVGYKDMGWQAWGLTHAQHPESAQTWYPCVPDLTARKVVQDGMDETWLLIRGVDLITEFSLYNYFCRLWDWVIPRQVFLPRLEQKGRKELSDVSKTTGNFKISDFRKRGIPSKEMWEILASSCLIDPKGTWTIQNVKRDPLIR